MVFPVDDGDAVGGNDRRVADGLFGNVVRFRISPAHIDRLRHSPFRHHSAQSDGLVGFAVIRVQFNALMTKRKDFRIGFFRFDHIVRIGINEQMTIRYVRRRNRHIFRVGTDIYNAVA